MSGVTLTFAVAIIGLAAGASAASVPEKLIPPVAQGIWLRPAADQPAEPTIGFRDGIRISLWPTGGPRGLIRIYAPYVFPEGAGPLINFIAIEPEVGGYRGYSEMENSPDDGAPGLVFRFADSIRGTAPREPWRPSRGRVDKESTDGNEIETLSVAIRSERFGNGSQPALLVTFRSDRPEEVSFRTYATAGGMRMQRCILTATMGNFARTRFLWLKDKVVDSRTLWPGYAGGDFVFAPTHPASGLLKMVDGSLVVAVTPNETDLASVNVEAGWFWHCRASTATQYWRRYPGTAGANLEAAVNGRAMYYGTGAPIPGGVAFENFELREDYRPGAEFVFGVSLKTPEELGWPKGIRPKS